MRGHCVGDQKNPTNRGVIKLVTLRNKLPMQHKGFKFSGAAWGFSGIGELAPGDGINLNRVESVRITGASIYRVTDHIHEDRLPSIISLLMTSGMGSLTKEGKADMR